MNEIEGIHPYTEKFPMLPEAELVELADSIAVNGLRLPIVITPDGLILDGRNRHAACLLAEVEPLTEVYDGDDLAEYVIDANITRRNMSTGARAMATALVLAADGRRDEGRWKRGSVDIAKSGNSNSDWQHRLSEAGIVLDFAPDLAVPVVNGEMPLDRAYRQACEARDAERNKLAEQERIAAEEADAKVFVEASAPDIAAMVVAGDLQSYAEGQAVWEKRNRDEAKKLADEKATKEKRLAQEKQGRSDLYGGMAKAMMVLSGYGGYDDVPKLMSEFNPAELNPPQLAQYLELEHLQDADRFITELLEWRKRK